MKCFPLLHITYPHTSLLVCRPQVETLAGVKVPVEVTDAGDVLIGKAKKAKVITTDIEAENGVIHVLDAVVADEEEAATGQE